MVVIRTAEGTIDKEHRHENEEHDYGFTGAGPWFHSDSGLWIRPGELCELSWVSNAGNRVRLAAEQTQ
jgi:hypothetical protein